MLLYFTVEVQQDLVYPKRNGSDCDTWKVLKNANICVERLEEDYIHEKISTMFLRYPICLKNCEKPLVIV